MENWNFDLPNVNTRATRVIDPIGPQNSIARIDRIYRNQCPLHEGFSFKQSSHTWYSDHDGSIFTFALCTHPGCKVECVYGPGKEVIELTPQWRFLLDQNDEGKGQVIQLRGNKN